MFKNKQGNLVGSHKEEEKVLQWDLFQSEYFYPTRKDIVDTNSFYWTHMQSSVNLQSGVQGRAQGHI